VLMIRNESKQKRKGSLPGHCGTPRSTHHKDSHTQQYRLRKDPRTYSESQRSLVMLKEAFSSVTL
jgi:hypothetical protein